MNDIAFLILQLVVSVSMIIAMRYVVPYLKFKVQNIMNNELWDAIVKEVKSVEQTITGYKLGPVKKEEVLVRITGWANSNGISITQEQLSQLIEAAVWIMNNEDKNNG